MLLQGALCQESKPHRVLSDGWSISDTCHSYLWLRVFLEMPMKRMLDEAPVERPHPSPFLRSWGLEFGNSLECWAWAEEQACRLSQPRVLGWWKETSGGRGRMLTCILNAAKYRWAQAQKIIPSDYDHPEITSYILVSVHTHFAVMCLSSGCHNKVPNTGWLINNRNFFSGLPWSSG